MEQIIENQYGIHSSIQKLCSNFKKDSVERKTNDYLNKRIETLDQFWAMYQKNHSDLSEKGDKKDSYFTDYHYQKTLDLYTTTRQMIMNFKGTLERKDRSERPCTSADDFMTPQKHQGVNSKTDDLLRKQYSNFRAFLHTVNSVDLDSLKERWELEDLLTTLQNRWLPIDTLHWELDSELEGSNEAYEQKFVTYEQTYKEMKKSINSKIWSTAHKDKITPQMEIPIFNGTYHQWTSFKDLFTEVVHNNTSISKAQKMQFLKGKVKGEAERLIQHLPISSENYETCWEILNHRYNNKKLIFTSHINTLLNLPVIQQVSINQIKRLHDTTIECVNAVRNLGVEVSTWDPLLVHILSQKLDQESHKDYLESLKEPRELPKLQEFLTFLESKFTTLESSRKKVEPIQQKSHQNQHSNQRPSFTPKKDCYYNSNSNLKSKPFAKSFHVATIKCQLCNKTDHGIFNCDKFLAMPTETKFKTAKTFDLCINCLYSHYGRQCTSLKRCRICQRPHNSLLHDFSKPKPFNSNLSQPSTSNIQNDNMITKTSHVSQNEISEILLATALIKVTTSDGNQLILRALIDQGSQISIITEKAAQRLSLKRKQCKGVIFGVGEKEQNCKGMITLSCQSLYNDYSFIVNTFIMKNLVKNLPNRSFQRPSWDYLENMPLADPQFYTSRPIDILLGADIYSTILLNGIIKGTDQMQPTAQLTQLGWILSGNTTSYQCNILQANIDEIKGFWEVQDIQEQDLSSSEDLECIQFYQSTTKRLSDGKYSVRLPLKSNFEKHLGNSKTKAVAQFGNLERKLVKNENISREYKLFMNEYISLGHMKPSSSNTTPTCYLPHHCVLRDDSTTTSLRVVFNASAKTSSGMSLNDLMHKGPNLQQNLQLLILKWRQFEFAFTADIEKMFRNIWIHEEDQNLQKIVWRDNPMAKLNEYQLTTVTYGTKAAPFLAMMTLRQLAKDERENYPEAAKIVEQSFYMDDLLHGSHSISSAKKLKQDLIDLMKLGGFNLRKWASNNSNLLQGQSNEESLQDILHFKQIETRKTLGLQWIPTQDNFTFISKLDTCNKKITKRTVLSDISKFFDPLGWLTPISTKLKILFQSIWLSKLDWDDKIPENILKEWLKIKDDIQNINNITIKRWLGTKPGCDIELHGFCDSSSQSYACVIYCKIKNQPTITLVAGKARLLPSKKTLSIPRSELCGAHLLGKLMLQVKQLFNDYNIHIYGWTDSTAVLGWLQGDPGRFKQFISNRVQAITKIMPSNSWRYVNTNENPADCASRGLSVSKLKQHSLWWQGPSWLLSFNENQNTIMNYKTDLEIKNIKQINTITKQSHMVDDVIYHLLHKYSSFNKLIRILAWILRITSKKEERYSYLIFPELTKAKQIIIKYVQQKEFLEDFLCLKRDNTLPKNSKLKNLNPFVDKEGILRVGGRLRNARIELDMKHPIIIPHDSRLTTLLIGQAHELTFHGGARLTLSNLRQKYWIIGGNRAVKKQLTKCITCRKHNPWKQTQQMGDLPDARINPAPPFYHTGVDYTGFVDVKINKGRGVVTYKGYIAIFVCLVTKATHLEIVSDGTSSAFLSALRRMAARRGAPHHMYSDNGTNFVGANRVLQKEYLELNKILEDSFFKEIASLNIKWHFNAPAWPSAGGLWERAVRSLKHHVKRVVGEQKLTFEEWSTMLAQIEACLNSRPLCPLSEDPEDLDFLTPAHFLTGRAGLTVIETDHDARTRWNLVMKITRDIWNKWKTEYITQLSARSKWMDKQRNIEIGDLVIIHEDNIPSGKWAMGRVTELHPGKDGLVRVVSLKTKNGYIKRPIVKLSNLPLSKECPKEEKHIKNNQSLSVINYKRKGLRTNFISLALSLMLFLNILSTASCSFNISNLDINQSLYFEPISKIQLIRDKWTLVAYFDMEPYWEGTKAFLKLSNYLDNICTKISHRTYCNMTLLQLRHNYDEVKYYNKLLRDQHFSTHDTIRRRRGLINAIGYVASDLFGVLDQRFAEKYEQDISKLKSNQQYMAKLWKNQTCIVESEYNLLKRMEDTIEKQHKLINHHINILDSSFNSIQEEIRNITLIQDFTLATITAKSMLENLKNIQTILLDTVTDIYHNLFSIHLLTPKQLQEELQIIRNQLPADLNLPINNHNIQNIREIYKLLRVKARMTDKYFIFEIIFPLISRDIYNLYKIMD